MGTDGSGGPAVLSWFTTAGSRLRSGWLPLAEAAAATTVAWFIATKVIGHTAPFFAPAAAIIVLGQARGMRLRRTVEVLLGVAGGVLLADIVAQLLGPHTTLTVFVVILLTLVITTAFGASTILVVQASVSALYVAVVTPPTASLVPVRFIDAIVGGVVALIVSQIGVVRDPLAPLIRRSRQMFTEISGVIDDTAAAIMAHDPDSAIASLERARQADATVEGLRTAVAGAAESLRLDIWRRELRGGVRIVDSAARQLDYVVRGVRVLARAGVTLTRLPEASPPELGVALHQLADAVRFADEALASQITGASTDAGHHADQAEEAALGAIRTAAALLTPGRQLPLVMIVGQIRSIAIDLLRGVGADDVEVLNRVDHAFGL